MRIYDNGVYRDMTAEELSEISDEENVATSELTTDDLAEMMGDYEYRLCLLELGVDEDDL